MASLTGRLPYSVHSFGEFILKNERDASSRSTALVDDHAPVVENLALGCPCATASDRLAGSSGLERKKLHARGPNDRVACCLANVRAPHLGPDDRLVTIDRVLHHASLGVA